MSDETATLDQPLTAEEVRRVMLRMAASMRHLQLSLEETIRLAGIKQGFGSAKSSTELHSSRLELAEALKILVKDPNDD
jgi:hypothetical protein